MIMTKIQKRCNTPYKYCKNNKTMLPLFCTFSLCWSEKLMATIGKIVLDKMGRQYQANLSNIFLDSGDFDLAIHPAQTPSWLYYVERAPFNIKSFNHWHFTRKPYNPENLKIPDYQDQDSLDANIGDLNESLVKGTAKKTWPYSFCIKILFAGIPDLQAPLHTVEYFSSKFPDGDRNGRLFNIYVNGRETNLYDFYESGCGLSPLQGEYDEKFWSDVKELADDLLEENTWKPENVNQNSVSKWSQMNYNWTVENIYQKLSPGDTVPQSMITECQTYTKKQMFRAAERLYGFLEQAKMITVSGNNQTPEPPMSTSEVMAWSLAAVLAPLTALLVWKKHCAKL